MQELEKIIQKTITNYPTCPIQKQLQKPITNYPPCPIQKQLQKPITEKTITTLITQLENHENELRTLRKQLQNQLLNYQINKITQNQP